MEWQTLEYKPLYILLADYLENRVRSGDFPHGAFLPPMRQLMRVFKVSLATVRGALELMEERALIKRRQGSGSRVIFKASPAAHSSPDTELDVSREISELFDLRAVLEPAALKAAFPALDRQRLQHEASSARKNSRDDLYRMDQALHEEIINQCPNRHLQEMLADIMKRIELYRELRFRHIDTTDARDFSMVKNIINAITAEDCAGACAGLTDHIQTTRSSLLSGLNKD
jgi:GntR family transcriptional repressor for pyruvate dehydrogenase complex